jgi:DNA-binding Lrp family transcriptional regulator
MNNTQNRDFKGVWIPKEIWLEKTLTITEKCLLVEIDSLDQGNGCFASNEYLAEFIGSSESSVANIISNLRKKGYIIDRGFDGRKRFISVSLHKKLNQPSQKMNPDVTISEHSNTVSNTTNNSLSTANKKIQEITNHPLFSINQKKKFPDLKKDDIELVLKNAMVDNANLTFNNALNWLANENKYKSSTNARTVVKPTTHPLGRTQAQMKSKFKNPDITL